LKKETKKVFGKHFIVWFVVFVILLIPASKALDQVGEATIFSGETSLLDEMTPITVDPDSPFYEVFQSKDRVNVLLVGVNGNLSDTIMLGSYDMKNQHVDVISIPRDTYYPRAGHNGIGQKKINAAYGSGGVVGTAEAVSDILMGMPIHYYVDVGYDDVEKIVEAIGGIPVDITIKMDYDDPYDKPPLSIHFEKGYKVLNGKEAVKFLRFRKNNNGTGYSDGDIGRIKAQQEFIKSAFKESLGLGLPKVVKTVLNTVESDMPLGMGTKIATKALGLSADNVTTYLTPGESKTREDKLSYWIVDEAGVKEMLMAIYSIGDEVPEDDTAEGDET